jgi:hypothetical protein
MFLAILLNVGILGMQYPYFKDSVRIAGKVKSIYTISFGTNVYGDTIGSVSESLRKYNKRGILTYYKRKGEIATNISEYLYQGDTALYEERYQSVAFLNGLKNHSGYTRLYKFKNGKKIACACYDSYGNNNINIVYRYKSDVLAKEEQFTDKNKYPTTITYYNENGDIDEVIYFLSSSTNNLFARKLFQYDTKRRIILEEYFASNGEYSESVWSYEKCKKILKKTDFINDKKTTRKEIAFFDKNGNLTDFYEYFNTEKYHTHYDYVMYNGVYEIKSETSFYGAKKTTSIYFYDDSDSHGNWQTRRVVTNNDETVVKRTISYYEK